MLSVILLATVAGLLQALAGIAGRKALVAGMPAASLVVALSGGLALAMAPWWFAANAMPLPDPWWLAPAVGGLLLAGNACLAMALTSGAASLAVPALSAKVVLAAVGTVLLGQPVSLALWIGALLASVGVAVLGAGPLRPGGGRTILMALAAAVCYAGFDLLVARFGTGLGIGGLLPAATGWALLGSLPLLAVARWPAAGRSPLLLSAGVNGLQCLALVGAIVLAGNAILPNVLYGCRGLWSVLLVPLFAAASADEREGRGFRLAGAGLISAAIVCALL